LSAADYQSAFSTYTGQGYRLTYVNAHEFQGQARFAAIWEKIGGAEWVARHGLSAADYQSAFDTYKQQGYRLEHVCGYTEGGGVKYAAIWDKASGPAYEARHGLSSGDYQKAFDDLNAKGYRLKVVSGYRAGSQDTYAAIWEKTQGPVWAARHGVPDAWYQNVFDNFYYKGYEPHFLNAFTSNSGGRMNGVWENTHFQGADLQAIEHCLNQYLSTSQAPGAAIAITKNERLVYAAGFGLADSGTGEELGPTNLMRIASVSKPITSAAVMKLVEGGTLHLDDKVFGPGGILSAQYPTPAGNQKINNITVRFLLEHVSGLSNTPNDPMFQNLAFNHQQLISWVLNDPARKVTRNPGAQFEYLNFGYCLLGRVIEAKSGVSYEQYVKTHVLAPSGVTDMRIGANAKAQKAPREVTYYPDSAYNLNVTRFDAHGGWLATPIDLVRFLSRVDGKTAKPDILSAASHTTMVTPPHVKDASNNDPGYAFGWGANPQSHNGAMDGTIAMLKVMSNGFEYAAIVNTRPPSDIWAGSLAGAVEAAISAVSTWPGYDLF
jgi:CubicO group peptidase (beta-lactamase class C family)